jgi:hypothetical protein
MDCVVYRGEESIISIKWIVILEKYLFIFQLMLKFKTSLYGIWTYITDFLGLKMKISLTLYPL